MEFPVMVAPHEGAWIEMLLFTVYCISSVSLPTRERGLKFLKAPACTRYNLSLPTRERGLKYYLMSLTILKIPSLPTRERGLK